MCIFIVSVTSRILNRFKQPKCQSHDLDIDPYFPNIHDVLRELGSRGMPCLGPVICESGRCLITSS